MGTTKLRLGALMTLLLFVVARAFSQVIFSAGFEGSTPTDWKGWFSDHAVWSVGVPSSNVGPGAAHGGQMCAYTSANLTNAQTSHLISPPITVPALQAGQSVILGFWQYYQISGSTLELDVSTQGSSGPWTDVSRHYGTFEGQTPPSCSGGWTYTTLDLSAYAGQTIWLGYWASGGDGSQAAGWYIDDVSVSITASASLPLNTVESFEGFTATDWHGWSADNGLWQVDTPSSGPGSGHGSSSCAYVTDNPVYKTDSRLVSPAIDLTSVPLGQQVLLEFWEWYQLSLRPGGDPNATLTAIEVSTWSGSTWTDWTNLQIEHVGRNAVDGWKVANWLFVGTNLPPVDLSAYVGKRIRIGFHLYQNGGSAGVGWFIDDLRIVAQTKPVALPTSFENATPTDWLGWFSDSGVWTLGSPPTNIGPRVAHSGQQCAYATNLSDFAGNTSSRLFSPPVSLPSILNGQSIQLSFWQYFAFSQPNQIGIGDVVVNLSDPSVYPQGDRITLTRTFGPYQGANPPSNSGGWVYTTVDLSAYAGKTVWIGFEVWGDAPSPADGWFIDDVSLAVKPVTNFSLKTPQGFEGYTPTNWQGWTADDGLWQIGTPTTGPGSGFQSNSCAFIYDDPVYNTDSRLISPPIDLPTIAAGQNISLEYWEWSNLVNNNPNTYSYGTIEVSTWNGSAWSDWAPLSGELQGIGNGWQYVGTNYPPVDLSAYAGQRIRLAFHFFQRGDTGGVGWFIDNVTILPPATPSDVAVNTNLISGATTVGTVYLDYPPPTGNVPVVLKQSNSSVSLPPQLTFYAHQGSQPFSVKVAPGISAPTQVTISASANGVTKSQTVTVYPNSALTSVSPQSVLQNSGALTLTVNGSNFVSGCTVLWNGSPRATTLVSPSQVTASLSSSDVAVAGTVPVTVKNGSGQVTNALSFVIKPPFVPHIKSISPYSMVQGSPGFTLTINGIRFEPSSVVTWGGSPRTTHFISGNQLTADIPASDLTALAYFPVRVVNPDPGGGTSNIAGFGVVPPPVTVILKNNTFSPSDITVVLGQRIIFRQEDQNVHTVTKDVASGPGPDSGDLSYGAIFNYTVPLTAPHGTNIFYHCTHNGTAGNGTTFGTGMVGVTRVR